MSEGYYSQPVDYLPVGREEEKRLFHLIHGKLRGCKRAEETLFRAYLLLAAKIGRRAAYRAPVEDEDVVFVANEALRRAIQNFDATRGVLFSTYATKFIHGSVSKLRAKATVRAKLRVSIDMEPSEEVNRQTSFDPWPDREEREQQEQRFLILGNARKVLEPGAQKMLKAILDANMNFAQAARKLRVSREWASQQYRVIVKRLREEFVTMGAKEA